ncbi:MAG: FtsX-like permease family protein [Oscillospiraceae bacterium]|nr:FtsX-like permease family protein [Oscillospiraceae bacterium]
MQAVKNGLKSALRTPGKTLLFVLILTVIAALLTVSCCVYGAVRSYLDDCDDYFHTIAELEYMGQDYPDYIVYDEGCADALSENRATLEALISSEQVLAWEPASAELARSPLIHRWDNSVPDPNAAVLRVNLNSYQREQGLYVAIVSETLYSRIDYTNRLIRIRMEDAEGLECPGSYLFAGRFVKGNTIFQQESARFLENGAYTDLPPYLSDGASPEQEALFQRYAENLRIKNDACRVSYTSAIEDLYPFHQQLMNLISGRFFTQAEYDEKAKVCIVSEKVAGMLGLGLGDKIPFTVFHAEGNLYDLSNHTEVDSGDYEIIGISSHSEGYPYWIFLPDAKAACKETHPVNGYSIGQFRLNNKGVPAFLEAAAPLTEQGFRLNIYDQGYAAATEPMEELLFISAIFLAVCLLLAACALALQSHLFISRQRETGKTMYALGSGKTHVCVFFLSAALAIVLPSALFGALIGSEAEGWVFDVLQRFAAQFANQDLRFSATRLAIVRTLDFSPNFSLGGYLTAAGILAGGTLIFTLFYALSSLREKKSSKKKPVKQRAPKKIGKVSRLSGPFKYGLLSLRRSHARTVAVLALGLAVALFFGQLTSSLADYQAQLETYKANASISGSATDFYGKRLTGLTLTSHAIVRLSQSDLVEDPCVTRKLGHITFIGVLGTDYEPYVIPEPGTFAYAKAFYVLNKSPVWTGTSSIVHSPLFHYSKSSAVEWLDGWSEEDFTRLETRYYRYYDSFLEEEFTRAYRSGPEICAMPKAMMEEYGLKLGDTIDTVITYTYVDDEIIQHLTLKVVASYVAPKGSATVFSPVSFVSPGQELLNYFPSIRYGESGDVWIARERWPQADMETLLDMGLSAYMDYSSFTFNLTDSTRLDELRQTMSEAGFTWVHSGERIKTFATIEDEVYINTTHSMERQIQYVRVLYNALYFLAGVIGFALAWLLIQSRRQEIAVMRALGTQPGRIVGSFLAEQLLLMALGLAIGAALSRLAGTPLSQNQLLLTAAFLGVWTLSALICLIVGLRKKSFAALTEPE